MTPKTPEHPYFSMIADDGLYISFEKWTDSRSIDLHQHRYYELLIVAGGSCRHMFHNTETLLIPGDVVLVPEHQVHGFSLGGECTYYNCQFRLSEIDPRVVDLLSHHGFLRSIANDEISGTRLWEQSLLEREHYYHQDQLSSSYELNVTKQGVIHLSPSELSLIISLLQQGLDEQEDQDSNRPLIRVKCLELILIELEKSHSRQYQKYRVCSKEHQKIIADILMYIELHLAETIDFNEIARENAFSPNHFRKIFKNVTGFSPLMYMNRLRIIRACEFIQNHQMKIPEAAEQVGIYDVNYFSRLFKKIMGCSPSKLTQS